MATRTLSLGITSTGGVKRLDVPPPALARFKVKLDQYSPAWDYKVRDAAIKAGSAPAVNRTGTELNAEHFRRSSFGRDWQFYAADLLGLSKYGHRLTNLTAEQRKDIVQRFNSLYQSNRFLTNEKGVDNCNNYLTGEVGKGEDPLIDPLVCADDILTGEVILNDRGESMVRILSFRPNEPPPFPRLDDPRVMLATVIYRNGILRPFPQLGGLPVPYPLLAVEPTHIPLAYLDRL